MGTRLTRITRELSSRDPDAAIAAAAHRVVDWSGGTRLGEALREFNDRWGVRGMARGAIVVILSDGWDRGDPDVLAEQMARLGRVAYRVVWVNPLKASPDFAPLARGMAAALAVRRRVRRRPLAGLARASRRGGIANEGGPVKEVLDDIERWRAGGHRVAVARVVGVDGSGPRDPGRDDGGERRGRGRRVGLGRLRRRRGGRGRSRCSPGTREPGVVTFGYSDDEAFAVGLTCGGTIHLFVEPLDW